MLKSFISLESAGGDCLFCLLACFLFCFVAWLFFFFFFWCVCVCVVCLLALTEQKQEHFVFTYQPCSYEDLPSETSRGEVRRISNCSLIISIPRHHKGKGVINFLVFNL